MSIWNIRNVDKFSKIAAAEGARYLGKTCGKFIDDAINHYVSTVGGSNELFAANSIHNDIFDVSNMSIRDLKILTRNIPQERMRILVIGSYHHAFCHQLQRLFACPVPDTWDYVSSNRFSGQEMGGAHVSTDKNFAAGKAGQYDVIFIRRPLNEFAAHAKVSSFLAEAEQLLRAGGRLIGTLWQADDAFEETPMRLITAPLTAQQKVWMAEARRLRLPALCTLPPSDFIDCRERAKSNETLFQSLLENGPGEGALRLSAQIVSEQSLINAGAVAPVHIVHTKPRNRKALQFFDDEIQMHPVDTLGICGMLKGREDADQLLGLDWTFEQSEMTHYEGPIELGRDTCPWQGWAGMNIDDALKQDVLRIFEQNCLVIGPRERAESIMDSCLLRNPAAIHYFESQETTPDAQALQALKNNIVWLDADFVRNINPGANRRVFDVVIVDTAISDLIYFFGKITRVLREGGTIVFFVRNSLRNCREKFTRTHSAFQPSHLIDRYADQAVSWFESIEGSGTVRIQRARAAKGEREYVGIVRL